MSHWNHRVVRYPDPVHGDYFAIDQVYYDEHGRPESHTETYVGVGSDSVTGLRWVLDRMGAALKMPVLDSDNWPNEWTEVEPNPTHESAS